MFDGVDAPVGGADDFVEDGECGLESALEGCCGFQRAERKAKGVGGGEMFTGNERPGGPHAAIVHSFLMVRIWIAHAFRCDTVIDQV